MNKLPIALIASSSLLLISCYVPYGTYAGAPSAATGPAATVAPIAAPVGAAPVSYNSASQWTSASYDANGYPIYGYSYGQPVYGYTDAGIAITTIAALTALCFIPDWGPASWYRGPAYNPRGHRYASPPRHSKGHQPSKRPSSHNSHNSHHSSHRR